MLILSTWVRTVIISIHGRRDHSQRLSVCPGVPRAGLKPRSPGPEQCLCGTWTELRWRSSHQPETGRSSSPNMEGEACGPRRAPAHVAWVCRKWTVFVRICATKYNETLAFVSLSWSLGAVGKYHIQELVVYAYFSVISPVILLTVFVPIL